MSRPNVINTPTNDIIESDSHSVEDAVDLLDTLGEKDIVADVEIQETWDS